MRRVLMIGLLLTATVALAAQQPATDAPVPPAKPELEAQVKALQQQLAALAQRVPPATPVDQAAKAQATYEQIYAEAEREAGPSCRKKRQGKLSVTLEIGSPPRVSVGCLY